MGAAASKLRKHRVVTFRMVVVSVVVGVVLAVGSVPVGAVLLIYGPLAQPIGSVSGADVDGGLAVILTMDTYRTGTVWFAHSPRTFGAAEVPDIVDTGAVESAVGTPRPARLDRMSGIAGGSMWVIHAGWPMDSASAYEVIAPPGAAAGVVGGLEVNTTGGSVVVPYLPVVPGFLGNALFYGAITLVILVALRLWRTRRRRARGRCVACGYELGPTLERGISVCPECGLGADTES